MIAGRLEIEMAANLATLTKDMNDAKRIVGGAMDDIAKYAGVAQNALAALGVGLSAGALLIFAKHTNDAVSAMKEFGAEAGVSAEALSRFEAPARSAGSSIEGVAASMFRMSKAALEARDPSSRAAQALNAIGISTAQLKGLKPDEMFELVARQIAKYSDGIEKNAVMQELFNKSGREMSRVIAEIAQRGDLAATVTNEQAAAANRLNTEIVELKMNSEKTWRSFIEEGVPALNAIIKAFLQAKEDGGFLNGVFAAIDQTLATMYGNKTQEDLKRINDAIKNQRQEIEDITKGARSILFTDEDRANAAAKLNALIKQQALLEHAASQQAIDDQNRRAVEGQKDAAGKPSPAFDPEAFKEAQRLRDLDNKGWVAYVDAVLAEADRENTELGRIHDEFWKGEDKKRTDDEAGWVKYIDATIEEYEKGLREIGDKQPSFFEASTKYWGQFVEGIESAFRDAFDSIGSGWKKALEAMKQAFERTLLDFIYQSLARPIVLQIIATGAGAMGMSGLAQAATSSIAGNALGLGGGSLSEALFGTAETATATGLAVPGTAGLLGSGGLSATISGVFGSTIAAVLPYVGWLVAAGTLIASLFGHGHGDKQGGSFLGSFSGSGNLLSNLTPGLDRSHHLQDETQQDPQAQLVGQNIAEGFAATLRALGGTSPGMQFGIGWNSDPSGTAPSMVSSLVRDAAGHTLFEQSNRNVGRDPAQLQAEIQLQSQRAILAALQASDLPQAVADILNSIVASTATSEQISSIIAQAQEAENIIKGLQGAHMRGLDIDALKAMQQDGETLTQTFQRVVGGFEQLRQAFEPAAQQMDDMRTSVTEAFAGLGVAVPQTREEFWSLVKGLDLSTETGRHMFEVLMQIAPAFGDVADAAQAALQTFYSLASSLSPAFGASYARTQFDAAVARWRTVSGTPADFDIEGFLRNMISTGSFGANLPFIQSLGPAGLDAFNAMLSAFQTLQQSMQQGAAPDGAIPTLTGTIGDLGSTATDSASQLDAAKKSVRDYLDALLINDQLSPLSPMDRLSEARSQFERLVSSAQGGDAGAMGKLSGASDAYLRIAREVFASGSSYVSIFNDVAGQLAGVSGYTGALSWTAKFEQVLPQTSSLASQADIQAMTRTIVSAIGGAAAANDEAVSQQTSDLQTPTVMARR